MTGGEHVSSMYEMVLQQTGIDACVIGEGEITLENLLTAFNNNASLHDVPGIAFLEQGNVIVTEARKRIMDVNSLPWPAWDLFAPEAYMAGGVYMGPTVGRSMPLLASRGCPFECIFCPAASMWKRLWRPRDPADVVDEIELYIAKYNANDFQLQDLTAIVLKEWIITFCKEIIRRKLNISWQIPVGTRSEAIDEEVVEFLVKSGCRHITYAPESGSERVLKMIKKNVNLQNLEESVKASLKHGMSVCLFNVIGFPGERDEDIRASFKWLRKMAVLGVHEITVSTFIPVPGSELFKQIDEKTPFTLDDEFCHAMTGLSSMFFVRSWNPYMSDKKLLLCKLSGLLQFYGTSFLLHPFRILKLIKNLASNKQETKIDRVLREFMIKIQTLFQHSKPPGP